MGKIRLALKIKKFEMNFEVGIADLILLVQAPWVHDLSQRLLALIS
jgi:hypothetical protein